MMEQRMRMRKIEREGKDLVLMDDVLGKPGNKFVNDRSGEKLLTKGEDGSLRRSLPGGFW